MKNLPPTEESLFLRTDFSDDAAWESLCALVLEPVGDFRAYVAYVSDPQYKGLSVEQIVVLASNGDPRHFLFVADQVTINHPEHPVLVVDLGDEPGRTFRVIPREVWGIENNLSIANMDFDEFARGADPDGVFRGFPES